MKTPIRQDPDQEAGPLERHMAAKLTAEFGPEAILIVNDSAKHAGHAEAGEGGETHFSVRIASDRFIGKNRIERHRMVHHLLAEELAGGIHSLALKLETESDGEH